MILIEPHESTIDILGAKGIGLRRIMVDCLWAYYSFEKKGSEYLYLYCICVYNRISLHRAQSQ